MRHIVIIGAGLSGLVTGYLLSKYGDRVTLLEHDAHPGGCLQSFYREGIRFDTGFHYVGGLADNNPMHYFFKELDLLSLPWIKQEGQEVHIGQETYTMPCGHEEFYRTLSDRFPHEKEGLHRYLETFREITSCPISETMPFWERGAWDFLSSTIQDPELRNILSGASLIVELDRKTLPLFAYAEILNSFICSTHRLAQGGQPIIDHLSAGILSYGGQIYCNATVRRIVEREGSVAGVELADGQSISADLVISSINPALTMQLLGDDSSMRKVFRRRMSSLKNSMGCFTLNIKLKEHSIPLRNLPVYVHHRGADTWNLDTPEIHHVLMHYYPEQNAIDLISPVSWERVREWDTPQGNNSEGYLQYKEQKARECLDVASLAIPGIHDAVDRYWSSTPLTWKRYLNSYNGSSYGVIKDINSLETTLLQPRTPLNGLYLTGQSMILHGIMGTTISAFLTAGTINNDISVWPVSGMTKSPFSFL